MSLVNCILLLCSCTLYCGIFTRNPTASKLHVIDLSPSNSAFPSQPCSIAFAKQLLLFFCLVILVIFSQVRTPTYLGKTWSYI
ncbi:hypothetical protein LIER_38172 [Lithospermum erythrorhizon]|uniref:Uncharacterized protein n=1 Tax=Lithospermum erythrorhizon TaxID=34254 RepID=A0AAV3PXN9_LITER